MHIISEHGRVYYAMEIVASDFIITTAHLFLGRIVCKLMAGTR